MIAEILSRGVVISTFDFAVAFAHCGMNGLAGVPIEVAREGGLRLA